MTLTKDDLFRIYSTATCSTEEYAELLNMKEDAEMLKSVKKDRDVAVEEWKKCEKIVEQIKKIDLHKIIRFTGTQSNDRHEQHNQEILKLQKILEGKK